ncbi:hypothetical protein BV25DRAFT_1731445 [Artomyces pyxidatus]|uniref:Uncharacterized protein n=1 Tax=Artomyces pyxidatus TaxID=48021 RepID=A0ACB8SHM8_9AGAM|nr:hypothetical protein BV25DRAFT_1731445 [Artomyces pyxidatus]
MMSGSRLGHALRTSRAHESNIFTRRGPAVVLKHRDKLKTSSTIPGSGRLSVPQRMQALVLKVGTGFFTSKEDGDEFRALYLKQISGVQLRYFTAFAQSCLLGRRAAVVKAVLSGQVPPLDGTATPYGFGYAPLVVTGSSQIGHPDHAPADHYVELLDFLLDPAVVPGCPPDVADIGRTTALMGAAVNTVDCVAELIRILVARGADINHRDIFGDTPIRGYRDRQRRRGRRAHGAGRGHHDPRRGRHVSRGDV